MGDNTAPQITRRGMLDMQVCVPSDWTDEQVAKFAEVNNPCGTTGGWGVRRSERLLNGDPVRQPCSQRDGFVHITLDA